MSYITKLATNPMVEALKTVDSMKSHMIAAAIPAAAVGAYHYVDDGLSAPEDPNAFTRDGVQLVTKWDVEKARDTIAKALKRTTDGTHDISMTSGLHRVVIPKKDVNVHALKYDNWIPSVVAVPERGQDRLTTYRQRKTIGHLHSHGKNWFLHRDKHPSLIMALQDEDTPVLQSIIDGVKHVGIEGTAGWYNWLSNISGMDDRPTMGDIYKYNNNPDKYPEVGKWLKKNKTLDDNHDRHEAMTDRINSIGE